MMLGGNGSSAFPCPKSRINDASSRASGENLVPEFISFIFHEDDNVSKGHIVSREFRFNPRHDKSVKNIETVRMPRKTKKQLTGFEKEVISRTRNSRRKIEDLNQDKIAALLGIPRATYANYEVDRIMDIELMSSFCRLCGVTVEYLLTGKDNPLISAYKNAESQDRRIVEKVLGLKTTLME